MTMVRWSDLPPEILHLVASRVGRVTGVTNNPEGSVRDIAATLHTDTGPVFCKATRTAAPFAWMLRNEIKINRSLPRALVPALRFHLETEGWLLAAFDHVTGRPPDLSPGSPDLNPLAITMSRLIAELSPSPTAVQPLTVRWNGLIDTALIDGDTLLHTDVTPQNFLVTSSATYVVDWSMPAKGAAWIDTALMTVRLIRAGHSPTDAERWANRVYCWPHPPGPALTLFARAYATLTARRNAEAPAAHRRELANAAEIWATHRTQQRLY